MPHSQLTNQVRELVRRALAAWNLPPDEELQETILIIRGHYAGRRFEASCGHAIWFLEEEQIKVYSASGELHQTLRLTAPRVSLARAA